jgi:hypothetical protein
MFHHITNTRAACESMRRRLQRAQHSIDSSNDRVARSEVRLLSSTDRLLSAEQNCGAHPSGRVYRSRIRP